MKLRRIWNMSTENENQRHNGNRRGLAMVCSKMIQAADDTGYHYDNEEVYI